MKNSGMRAIIFLMCISIFGCDVRILGSIEDIYFDGYADSKVRDNMIDDVMHIGDILIGDEETVADEIGYGDIYTDYGSDDVDVGDESGNDVYVCEQYKCENLIYGRDGVYVDKESGSIYFVEYGDNEMKFSKYDKNGEFIWEKRAEGGRECLELEYVDRDENFYISEYSYICTPKGSCECRGSMSKDTLIKYRKDGDGYKEVFSIRSSYLDISSIAIDLEGNIYIAGEYKNIIDFGNGVVLDNSDECRYNGNPYNPAVECFTDVFVAKFNRDGKALWAKSLEDGGGTSIMLYKGFIYFDVREYTEREEDGKKVYSSPYKIKIVKLDAGGNYKWSRVLVQEPFFDETKFTIDKDGSIYIYGLFDLFPDYKDSEKYKNLNIAKFDNNGEFKWGREVIGREGVDDIVPKSISLADKVIYISGYPEYSSYFFLSKIAKNGDLIWYKLYDDDKINTVKVKLSISDDEFFYAIIPIYGNSMQIDNCSNKSFPGDLYKKYLLKFVAEPCDNIETDR